MEKFFSTQVKQLEKKNNTQQEDHVAEDETPKKFPKGVVLGKDGKPCRSCTSFADWAALPKKKVSHPSTSTTTTSTPPSVSTSSLQPPADCPPDVEQLGRSTWTLLHTISASYPPAASQIQQSEMRQFLSLFSKLYPCWVCADDFREWMSVKGNEPRVEGRAGLGRWMCEAHNEVNRKLGKEEFDCGKWEERWRTGWKDGRCD
ncbi:MAG: hypothetical protein M1830_005276 [Pleopsidium flavum]|nr:MAG: hypothetical protein M1830_005276 [Pleopsidium flavum]